ncbi:MAG: hypothetical protein ACFE9L_14275 [Candidatus Hodarchaeota archaeon]
MGEETIGQKTIGRSAIKLDSLGNIVWTKFHNIELNEFLVGLDEFGNIEWIQNFSEVTSFENNLYYIMRYVKKTPDTGFICILEEHYEPNPDEPFEPNEEEYYYLVKVDAQGILPGQKNIDLLKLKLERALVIK